MKFLMALIAAIIISGTVVSQNTIQDKFKLLEGKWQGTGTGFSGGTSEINAEFNFILGGKFMEVKNHSEFAPSEENEKGDIHDDWGIISYDSSRKKFVFRQFHNEGYYNQYVLKDSLSNEKSLVFETEYIENFIPGGKARFTINLVSKNEITTLFDVGFPGREMACFGNNKLQRVK